ncbi:MAG: hypothetical protein ABFD04_01920 [Syntrophomonas sp.]
MKNRELVPLKARACYGHLGGTLGERMFQRFIELGWLERDGQKATVYELTEEGKEQLTRLGIDIYKGR